MSFDAEIESANGYALGHGISAVSQACEADQHTFGAGGRVIYGTSRLTLSLPEGTPAQDWSWSEPCMMGIDEAGRGPVLGPLVYGACVAPCSKLAQLRAPCADDPLKPGKRVRFMDSKQLNDARREVLFTVAKRCPFLAWFVDPISAADLSRDMLTVPHGNLNTISHDSAMNLIRLALKQGLNVKELYVDTVGSAPKYQAMLQAEFPSIEKIVVASKADDTYPICSAASVCAKISRDRLLSHYKHPEALAAAAASGVSLPPPPPSTAAVAAAVATAAKEGRDATAQAVAAVIAADTAPEALAPEGAAAGAGAGKGKGKGAGAKTGGKRATSAAAAAAAAVEEESKRSRPAASNSGDGGDGGDSGDGDESDGLEEGSSLEDGDADDDNDPSSSGSGSGSDILSTLHPPSGAPLGSGYPGDAVTKAWLRDSFDKVFGPPQLVRFSWGTTTKLVDELCVPAKWGDEPAEGSATGSASASAAAGGAAGGAAGAKKGVQGKLWGGAVPGSGAAAALSGRVQPSERPAVLAGAWPGLRPATDLPF